MKNGHKRPSNAINLRKQVQLLNRVGGLDMESPRVGPQTTKNSTSNGHKGLTGGEHAKADSRTDREEERMIKGIPVRQFCDEVFR